MRLFDRDNVGLVGRRLFSRRVPTPVSHTSPADVDPLLSTWFQRALACEERGEAAAAGDATARRHDEVPSTSMSDDSMESMLREWLAKRDARPQGSQSPPSQVAPPLHAPDSHESLAATTNMHQASGGGNVTRRASFRRACFAEAKRNGANGSLIDAWAAEVSSSSRTLVDGAGDGSIQSHASGGVGETTPVTVDGRAKAGEGPTDECGSTDHMDSAPAIVPGTQTSRVGTPPRAANPNVAPFRNVAGGPKPASPGSGRKQSKEGGKQGATWRQRATSLASRALSPSRRNKGGNKGGDSVPTSAPAAPEARVRALPTAAPLPPPVTAAPTQAASAPAQQLHMVRLMDRWDKAGWDGEVGWAGLG